MSTAPWRLSGEGNVQTVPALGAPGGFQNATQITTLYPNPSNPATVQLTAVLPQTTQARQWLRFRLWARSQTSNRIELVHELANDPDPNSKALAYLVKLTPEWKEYAIPYPAAQYAPAASAVRVRAGFDPGIVEVAGIALEDFGMTVAPPPAINFDPYGGVEISDGWRIPANARIDRFRKGDLRVRVVDAAGRPVPQAKVNIDQTRHLFLFGTAVRDEPLLGNSKDADRYRAEVSRLFNYASLENSLNWNFRGTGEYTTADKMLRYLKDREIPTRGHNLFWPGYRYLPPSVQNLRGDALRTAVEQRIRDTVSRFRNRVEVWDVVREAYGNTEIFRDSGRELLWNSYRWAREMDPDVELAYNDTNIANSRGGANDGHRAAVMKIIKELLDADVPLNLLGDQAHMAVPLTPIPKVLEAWEELAQFGLQFEISEFDINFFGPRDEAAHAKYLDDFLTAAFSQPKICSFVLWGFWDGAQALGDQGAGLYRRDWSARPALGVWERRIYKDWWTTTDGVTSTDGSILRRVFLGNHKITVTVGETKHTSEVYIKDAEDAVTELVVQLPRP